MYSNTLKVFFQSFNRKRDLIGHVQLDHVFYNREEDFYGVANFCEIKSNYYENHATCHNYIKFVLYNIIKLNIN